jgi:predicted signal transduction protein with EAL and GGDEF domain
LSSESIIRALPDLLMALRRDGVILELNAGHGLGDLKPGADSVGRKIEQVWPNSIASLVKQAARKAIASRNTVETRFQQGGRDFNVRASAQGPDRALCVIQAATANIASSDTVEITAEQLPVQFDRRGFMKRFKESVAMATLREAPLAIAVIYIEGIADVAQSLSTKISEQIMTTAILRLCATNPESDGGSPWYLGQLSDSQLALVLESADREALESRVEEVCSGLREPIEVAGSVFQLTPSAGIAIHGQDAPNARGLLDHAQAAAGEARRGEQGGRISFFTEKLRLKSLAVLDLISEVQGAISNGGITLRYAARHDLETGKLVGCAGYMRWSHPLRGDIRPLDFLRTAESTGLGMPLSRGVLQWLEKDCSNLLRTLPADIRISFFPLRHHIAHDGFVSDVMRMVEKGAIAADRLELRIAEKDVGVRRPEDFKPLADAGIRLLVDEVYGRGPLSIEWLANAPFHGLQLKRELVVAAAHETAALKICRAAIALGRSLGLLTSAVGIDTPEARTLLMEAGCQQGSGDLYPPPKGTARI